MAFCSSCGAPINPDSKFCSECGATNLIAQVQAGVNAVANASVGAATSSVPFKGESDAPVTGERIQEFSGKIAKCPNCGEVLKALAAKCPACGFELREVGNASSVKEFADKLAKTISSRQKIELIRSYPIPNAKADIFEFLVLATSNFETKKHMSTSGTEHELSEAWLSKIEQSYVKAETLFKNDKDFGKFEEIYNSDIRELRAAEANKANAKHYGYGTVMMLMAAFVFTVVMLKGSGIASNPRLVATSVVFFINGIISYVYANNRNFKLVTLIAYSVNAILNIAFCLVAPGHLFHVLVIIACALGAFIDKKK